MKYSRPLLLAITVSLLSTSALAAPVFMLQFGSFETKDEATTHLNDMKTKHADVVGSLNASIREVTLPPDNLTVYRTQAGPVASRADAQSICGKLAIVGENCFVVETAMMDQGASPAVAAAAPAAPVKTTNAASNDTQSGSASGVALASPGFKEAPIQQAAATPATTDNSAMNAAMDQAAARQATGAEIPKVSEVPAPKKPRSFWSRMNPFSDDDQTAQAAPKPVPAAPVSDTALAVPVDHVIAGEPPAPAPGPMVAAAIPPAPPTLTLPPTPTPMIGGGEPPSLPSPSLVTGPEPVTPPAAPLPSTMLLAQSAPPPPPVMPVPLPTEPPPPPHAVQPVTPPPAPVVNVPASPMIAGGSSIQLPPPPPPLRAQDREALAAGKVPPSAPPIAAPAVAPQSTGELPQIAAAPLATPAVPFKQGPSTQSSGGEVVTQGSMHVGEPHMMLPVVTPQQTATAPQASQLAPELQPSATIGEKTLWAQIGQFNDAQDALSFWETYRRSHPDFPIVRVRVTTPYQAQLRGTTSVSLRVGPFGRVESINNLCGTVPAGRLQCGSITDLGVAADPNDPGILLPDSRYHH